LVVVELVDQDVLQEYQALHLYFQQLHQQVEEEGVELLLQEKV
jgi:hypothetical protein